MDEKNSRKATCLIASVLLWASSAVAVDGVIEINQAKAIAGGVNGSLASDPAGFPVVITQPGSYRLTGNLTVSNSNTSAIEVAAAHVDVDLNGFSILGPNGCGGTPTTCTANGSGVGVHAPNPANFDTRVHDGTVKGMGAAGVALQGWAHVSRLNVQENGGTGIFAADHSIVGQNRVINNGGIGIHTFTHCSLEANHVASNGNHGIFFRSFSKATRNMLSGNGSAGHCGIAMEHFGGGASASQNTIFDNPRDCINGNCCALSPSPGFPPRLLDCNMIQNAAGALQRCCPNPATGTDVCS